MIKNLFPTKQLEKFLLAGGAYNVLMKFNYLFY